jgi:VanZ family protein
MAAPWHHLSLWLPVAAVLALSFWLSSRPGDQLPERMPDFAAHFVEYLALGLVAARAFNDGLKPRPSARTFVLTVALGLGWAVADEYHQSLVPGRHASGLDVACDLAGTLAACGLFPWLRRGGLR